jgi:starch phosphorylase
LVKSGYFCYEDRGLFNNITDIFNHDTYMIAADFDSYVDAQAAASELYRNQDEWTKKALINIANMGIFSSDRTISQYAEVIWKVKPL